MITVIRLLDHRGTYFPRTHCLGLVEIRNPRADTVAESDALAESGKLFGDPKLEASMRIATVVDTRIPGEADLLAEERFEEALDVFSAELFGMSRPALLSTGAFHYIADGRVLARTPDARIAGPPNTPVFRVMRERFARPEFPQFLLAGKHSELSERLIRSYHWSRKAHLEASLQMRVLFRWFAMEAVWMLGKDDDILPRVMWALGFPTGQKAKVLSAGFVDRLSAHPTYSSWRGQIEKRLDAVRRLRNDSVHNGFRPQDMSRQVLREFDEITTLACSRVQSLARASVIAGLRSAADLFEYLPVLVEDDDNYINDVHGTIIYGLEHPAPWR